MKVALLSSFPVLLLAAYAPVAANAATRTSANYTVTSDTTDLGGTGTASANYTNAGGVGTVAGVSGVSSPAETGRNGYVGQLTELAGFGVAGAAVSIPQATADQLSGTATLDDGTTSVLDSGDIQWSAVTYPFASISLAGLLTAGNVYGSSSGPVTGSYLSASSSVTIQVTGGPYTGAGIPDSWYYQYFGPPPHASAAPGADADGTGQPNLFKYLAGLNPVDGSRFVLTIGTVDGQHGGKALTFTPVYNGRTYTPQISATLVSPAWVVLTNATTSDNGTTRTVIDPDAGGVPRFYRVQITVP